MTRVIVPVAILNGETVAAGLMRLLGTVDVTVLGYQVLPDQTDTDQARRQYEERATSALEDIVQEIRQAGGDADYRLVFTHDRHKTIHRVADETGSRAIVTTGPTGDLERVLVSLTGDVAVDKILGFVTELIGDRDIGATLFVAGEKTEGSRTRLEDAVAQLEEAGVDVLTKRAPEPSVDALLKAVPGHDAIVVGEKSPSLASLVFGEEADRIASTSVSPVLVVTRDNPQDH